jgi:hypothetical protein
MQKTKRKIEVYRTTHEILESKKLDSAHPIVAGFLSIDKKLSRRGLKLTDVDLSEQETKTLSEAFSLGGRYRKAESDLPLTEKPYSAAARALESDDDDDGPVTPKIMPFSYGDRVSSYSPDYMSPAPVKPYKIAAQKLAKAEELRDYKEKAPAATPLATPAKPLPSTKPIMKKDSYRPNYMYLSSEKPYDRAAKLLKLEEKLRDGKISKRLYEELKSNYT